MIDLDPAGSPSIRVGVIPRPRPVADDCSLALHATDLAVPVLFNRLAEQVTHVRKGFGTPDERLPSCRRIVVAALVWGATVMDALLVTCPHT